MAKVDELIVEINADIRDLKRKLEEAAEKAEKEAEKMEGSFSKVTKALDSTSFAMKAFAGAAGVAAAAAGGVVVAMNKVSDIVAENRLGKRVRIGTERFQELSFAAKTVGLDAEGLADAIKDLSVKITDTAKYGGALTDALDGIGLEAKELAGLSPEEQFLRFADAIKKADIAAGDFAADEINDAMYQMIPLLRQGSEGFEEMALKARRLGVVISSEEMKGFEQLNQTFVAVKASMGGIINALLVQLEPALKLTMKAAQGLTDALAYLNRTEEDFAYIQEKAAGPLWKMKEALEREHAILQERAALMSRSNVQEEGFQGHLKATQRRAREVAQALSEVNAELVKIGAMETGGMMTGEGTFGGTGATAQGSVVGAPIGGGDDKEAAANSGTPILESQSVVEAELERLDAALHEKQVRELEAQRLALEQRQAFNDAINNVDERAQEYNNMLWESGWRGKSQIMSQTLGSMSKLMNSESRKMFEVGKAAAMAQVLIDTPKAAMSAYSAMAGIPVVGPALGAAAAAAAIATGMGQLQQIKSASFGGSGGGGGGSVEGGGAAGGAASEPQEIVQTTNFDVTLQGDSFSGDQIRGLIGQINEATEDNVKLNAVMVS